jgi:hypothetical protein
MREIPLTKGAVTLVDDDDFVMLARHRWYLHSGGYAARVDSRRAQRGVPQNKTLLMHRVILQLATGEYADHIDGNKLNNTRANLRRCCHRENCRNRRPRNGRRYKGVKRQRGKTFRATITIDGDHIHLGNFPTAEEAARAYDTAATTYFGAFARLNFPHLSR